MMTRCDYCREIYDEALACSCLGTEADRATTDRREAEEREAEAWDTYHAIRGASIPPDWPQEPSSW